MASAQFVHDSTTDIRMTRGPWRQGTAVRTNSPMDVLRAVLIAVLRPSWIVRLFTTALGTVTPWIEHLCTVLFGRSHIGFRPF